MNRFHRRLPGSRRAPPGLERALLCRMPVLLLAGTLLPALYALAMQWLAPDSVTGMREMLAVRYEVFGIILFHWMAVLLATLGCVIVSVMKAHAVVADACELPQEQRRRGCGDMPRH